ncbi:hypothetical protein KSP39_PZI005765 [Platanthera zijinensis]|uniref:Transposase (putative) gypsy type domain-containing protein n=1 Tax=Platanthera zijinensis TaxID=2320716 RepID=A0AAP0GBL6_9ASPA
MGLPVLAHVLRWSARVGVLTLSVFAGIGKGNPDSDGRAKCARHFVEHCFFEGNTTEEELAECVADYVPSGFTARLPTEHEVINSFYPDELAFPISHFELGLRLPLWPEIRQMLKYYGAVPAQLNPNAIAMMVALVCYLRRERIKFNLTVFRKLFSYKATPDGGAFFGGSLIKVRKVANKHHNWMTKIVFINGDLGNVPFSPQQKDEEVYRSPSVSGNDADLHKLFLHKDFEVAHSAEASTPSCSCPQVKVCLDSPCFHWTRREGQQNRKLTKFFL